MDEQTLKASEEAATAREDPASEGDAGGSSSRSSGRATSTSSNYGRDGASSYYPTSDESGGGEGTSGTASSSAEGTDNSGDGGASSDGAESGGEAECGGEAERPSGGPRGRVTEAVSTHPKILKLCARSALRGQQADAFAPLARSKQCASTCCCIACHPCLGSRHKSNVADGAWAP